MYEGQRSTVWRMVHAGGAIALKGACARRTQRVAAQHWAGNTPAVRRWRPASGAARWRGTTTHPRRHRAAGGGRRGARPLSSRRREVSHVSTRGMSASSPRAAADVRASRRRRVQEGHAERHRDGAGARARRPTPTCVPAGACVDSSSAAAPPGSGSLGARTRAQVRMEAVLANAVGPHPCVLGVHRCFENARWLYLAQASRGAPRPRSPSPSADAAARRAPRRRSRSRTICTTSRAASRARACRSRSWRR